MALIDNLVSYYKLDESAANTTVADSHGSNTGTASTNTSNLYDASGKINSAFDFTAASSEYVTVVTNDLDGLNILSYSIWFKPGTIGVRQTLIESYGTSYYFGLSAEIGTDNKVTVYMYDGTLVTLKSTTSVQVGNWYHLVVTRTTTDQKLYLNNSLEDSDTESLDLSGYDYDGFRIGTFRDATSRYFDGEIDEVAIFDADIGQQGATDLYNSGNGLAYPFGVSATTRQVKISGSFVAKPYKIKVAGTFVDKPAKVKVSGTFQ